jgi:hypothetical protein
VTELRAEFESAKEFREEYFSEIRQAYADEREARTEARLEQAADRATEQKWDSAITGTERATDRTAAAIEDAADTGFTAASGAASALAKAVESMFTAAMEFLFGGPRLTPDQAERKHMADAEKAENRDQWAAMQERAAGFDWQAAEAARQQQYDDLINGRVTPRQREREEDERERGRERER